MSRSLPQNPTIHNVSHMPHILDKNTRVWYLVCFHLLYTSTNACVFVLKCNTSKWCCLILSTNQFCYQYDWCFSLLYVFLLFFLWNFIHPISSTNINFVCFCFFFSQKERWIYITVLVSLIYQSPNLATTTKSTEKNSNNKWC